MSWSVNRTIARQENQDTGCLPGLPTSLVFGLVLLAISWSLLMACGSALAKKPDNPGGGGNGEEDFCPAGSISDDPSQLPGKRVDVFKDGDYVVSTSSIACALTGVFPTDWPVPSQVGELIVSDPLDGNYELVCQAGVYDEIMVRGHQGSPSRGILVNKRTLDNANQQWTLTIRAATEINGNYVAAVLGGPGSERPGFRLAVVSPADFTTIEGLTLSNAINGIGVQPGDNNSDGNALNNVTILNCYVSDTNGPLLRGIFNNGHTDDHDLHLCGNQVSGATYGIYFKGGRFNCDMVWNDVSSCDFGITLRGSDSPNVNWVLQTNVVSQCTTGIQLAMARIKGKTYMPDNTMLIGNTICASGAGAVCIDVEEPDPFFPDGIVIESDSNHMCVTDGAATGFWGNVVAISLSDWQTISGEDAESDDVCP